MPFLIRNINPSKRTVQVRNEGTTYTLAAGEQVVLDIRNITGEMFLQSMRGEITSLFVARMPVEKPEVVTEEEISAPEPKEVTKPAAKKSKSEVSE